MKKHLLIIVPFLLLSLAAMVAGLWAGLVRLGLTLPALTAALPMQHGPLMISGFLGTLIALERVAALHQRWMYAAPALSGAGWVLSLALPASGLGPAFILLGSLVTTGILAVMVRREPKIYTMVMACGALGWLGGNVLWVSGKAVALVVWWWAAFLVLTIAGERLELSRVLRFRPVHYRWFALAAGLFGVGVVLHPWLPETGARIAGGGMLALAAWLARYDIARRNLRHPAPLTRFIAVCLFAGYGWLGVSGILNLALGALYAGPLYDAVLHALFVGFVISMIFGHAPIILPALTGIQVTFRPIFYLPLILMHGSLVLRILGDLLNNGAALRRWGGIWNEIAILLFIGLFLYSIIQARVKRSG